MTAAPEQSTAVVMDMPDADYHAHPALSSSGARLLLPPNCPALYAWRRDNPEPPRRAYDVGHVAHRLILGAGADFHIVHADDWRTKDARTERDDARASGFTPILAADHLAAVRMADAVRTHPIAGRLLAAGRPEVSLFWTDSATEVPCRARLDWLTDGLIVDCKTARSADPGTFRRSAADHGYHVQDAWYREAARAVLGEALPLVFIAVEKDPPHLTSVVQLDPDDVDHGAHLARRAREVFAECAATGIWPGYGDDEIHTVRLPAWAQP